MNNCQKSWELAVIVVSELAPRGKKNEEYEALIEEWQRFFYSKLKSNSQKIKNRS